MYMCIKIVCVGSESTTGTIREREGNEGSETDGSGTTSEGIVETDQPEGEGSHQHAPA